MRPKSKSIKHGSFCPSVPRVRVFKRLSWLVSVLTLLAPFPSGPSMKSVNIASQESLGVPSQILMNITGLATITRKKVFPNWL